MLWVVLTIAVSLALGIAAERRYAERASAAARRMLRVLLYGFTPPVAFLNIVGLELGPQLCAGVILAEHLERGRAPARPGIGVAGMSALALAL